MNMYVVKNLYGINIPVLYTKLWFTEKVGHWTNVNFLVLNSDISYAVKKNGHTCLYMA